MAYFYIESAGKIPFLGGPTGKWHFPSGPRGGKTYFPGGLTGIASFIRSLLFCVNMSRDHVTLERDHSTLITRSHVLVYVSEIPVNNCVSSSLGIDFSINCTIVYTDSQTLACFIPIFVVLPMCTL